MSKIAIEFGIEEALKALGIKNLNDGSSTGSNNFSSGEIYKVIFSSGRIFDQQR